MPQKPFLVPFEKNKDDEINTSPTEAPILSGDTIDYAKGSTTCELRNWLSE